MHAPPANSLTLNRSRPRVSCSQLCSEHLGRITWLTWECAAPDGPRTPVTHCDHGRPHSQRSHRSDDHPARTVPVPRAPALAPKVHVEYHHAGGRISKRFVLCWAPGRRERFARSLIRTCTDEQRVGPGSHRLLPAVTGPQDACGVCPGQRLMRPDTQSKAGTTDHVTRRSDYTRTARHGRAVHPGQPGRVTGARSLPDGGGAGNPAAGADAGPAAPTRWARRRPTRGCGRGGAGGRG